MKLFAAKTKVSFKSKPMTIVMAKAWGVNRLIHCPTYRGRGLEGKKELSRIE